MFITHHEKLRIKAVISKFLRAIGLTLFALILLVSGTVILIYSPWAQDMARQAVVSRFDGHDGGMRIEANSLRLRFPLTLEADGVMLSQNGDTLMSAGRAEVRAAILPLLKGRADVESIVLTDATYILGAPDSAMYMTIRADSIGIAPASVGLADMAITVDNGTIRGGRLDMVMNPDTTAATPPSDPLKMSIDLNRMKLEDFGYSMRMMPTIDTLTAHIATAHVDSATVNMTAQRIDIQKFAGSGLDARYIAPDSSAVAAFGPVPETQAATDSTAAAPWTVTISQLDFDRSHALYTTAGTEPLPGLDFGYIEVSDLDLHLNNFYNQASTVLLPLSLRGRERCGVSLAIDGELGIDATALTFKDVRLSTPEQTTASFDGLLGMGDMTADPDIPVALKLDGAFAPSDLELMFPAFRTYLNAIPGAEDIRLETDIKGTMGRLGIDAVDLSLNRCVNLHASGVVENCMDPDRLGGDIALRGNIINVNSFKRALLDPATAKSFNIPPMTLQGNVTMKAGAVNGRLTARTGKGALKLDGRWNGRRESYTASLDTREFPVNAFMPLLGAGAVTASLKADGRGYDPMSKRTAIKAEAYVASAAYQDATYSDISVKATLAEGKADIHASSDNPNTDFTLDASGNLDGKVYTWTADIDGRHIDLFALKLATEPSSVELSAKADATIGPGTNDISAHLELADLFFVRPSGTIGIEGVKATLAGSDSLTDLSVVNRDLNAHFTSPCGLDSLTACFGKASEIMASQIAAYTLDVDTLGKALPHFRLGITGGHSNLVNDILAPSDMSVRSFRINAVNDSTLTLNGSALRFDTGSMTLDTLYLQARRHDSHLHLDAGFRNRPGNLDEWHQVSLQGRIDGSEAALGVSQENLQGKTGYRLGISARMSPSDSTATLSIKPYAPVIGYQTWSVNDDNFISYHIPDKHIDANIRMKGGNSSLAVFTEHVAHEAADSTAMHQEDLVVQLDDIHIADWISFSPFAPPVTGDVDANMRVNLAGGIITGKGSAGITNFKYGKEKVADFETTFDLSARASGTVSARADLMVNGVKTMTINGALNDSTSTTPLALDFAMIHFPLSTVNPFMPTGTAKMRGTLNGNMKISGTQARPVFNGTLDFDSTAVNLALTGTDYTFSPEPINVEDNTVRFDRFTITGCNTNPLFVDGTVDISDMTNMKLNLGLKADNMMIVDSNRLRKGADVYGKAYISLNARARGSMELLNVNADLSLLSNTNVTYVMTETTSSALTSKSTGDMVQFVNFTDSIAMAQADSIPKSGMAMFLDAVLNIENGSTINVDLSPDGKNRVQLQANGTLTYAMTPLDMGRLTGRLNIDRGFVRYTPPFMSEKNFVFSDNSYVAFNGDMLNPSLNVHASDNIKANVTQNGQNSRLVNFDVLLAVTGTLSQMDVAFDLSTNDDMTVANELESMSPDQRANQAMNLLLYKVYTGQGTRGDAALSGNPLFSFLESQINSWAQSNIKGVDISFGIDQYDRTVDGSTSQTMSYSYHVSKSLFNDRFKIVVGGNYSTDANADENFSQNLINDISFEYFLNAQRTMYVRLFRHTGYESILEGEITQTGVGFVYRRKLSRLGDMFLTPGQVRRRQQRENRQQEQDADDQQQPQQKETTEK